MKRWLKKIFAWSAGLIAGLFVLILLVLLVLPQLVNIEAVKKGILEAVSRETGGELAYSRVEILYLPRPTLTLQEATLAIRSDLDCSLSIVRVYPNIAALLKGRIRIAGLQIENPHLTYRPSAGNNAERAKPATLTTESIRAAAASFLAIPAFQTPGFHLRVKNGRLMVQRAAGSNITFDSLDVRVHRREEKLGVNLTGATNLGRKVTLTAQVFPGSLSGFAVVEVLGFRPHLLLDQRQTQRFFPVVDSRLDLELKLQLEAPRRQRIEMTARNPFFRFRRPGMETVVKSKAVKAVANIRNHTTVISVSDVRLDQPDLQVSGSFFMSRSDPEIRLNLTGAGIDVAGLRQAALTLMGKDKTVRQIFEVITGGHVPIITVHAQGKSPADLSQVQNYLIRGNIFDGDLFIPGIDWQISKVRGEASISGGLLTGTKISAQMGNSTGKSGHLTLGLLGADAPFHLDIETQADVAQLQPVLMQLVNNETFRKELRKISFLSGTAEGRLVIGEQLNDLKVTASANNAHMYAEYARIAQPVVISGGQYLIHSTRFLVDRFNARIGHSELRQVSIGFDWSENGFLKVSGGASEIDVIELTDWLASIDHLQPKLRPMKFLGGTVFLSQFGIKGPLHQVGQWQYDFGGKAVQLGFRPTQRSDDIWVEAATFTADPTGPAEIRLEVYESQFSWGNTAMQLVGNARISASGVDMDADLVIDEITGMQISQLTDTEAADADNGKKRDFWPRWMEGVLRVSADRFVLGNLTFTPVEAGVILNPGKMTVKIHRADMCGISVPSVLTISPWELNFNAEPETAGTTLDSLFTCLTKEPGVMTGIYQITGNVASNALNDGFYRSLDGQLQFTSQSGRIYRHGVLAKILALLNLTEIFRGRLPDIVQKGFGYETMKITGEFENGILYLREGLIDGSSMTIAFDGHYDLLQQQMDILVLVAPFKTFDAIIKNLPVVNNVLGGRLISIPFRVEGRWESSDVRPAAVGEVDPGLLGILNKSQNVEFIPSQPIPMENTYERHRENR